MIKMLLFYLIVGGAASWVFLTCVINILKAVASMMETTAKLRKRNSQLTERES